MYNSGACDLKKKTYGEISRFIQVLEVSFLMVGNFFTECHFWADVMLRQPPIGAARVSPAQKLRGLRLVHSKTF